MNILAKFIGACNDHKYALDKCFKMEKEWMREQQQIAKKKKKSSTSALE
jgi:hypothetical protein